MAPSWPIPLFDRQDHPFVPTWLPTSAARRGGQGVIRPRAAARTRVLDGPEDGAELAPGGSKRLLLRSPPRAWLPPACPIPVSARRQKRHGCFFVDTLEAVRHGLQPGLQLQPAGIERRSAVIGHGAADRGAVTQIGFGNPSTARSIGRIPRIRFFSSFLA